MRKQMRFYRFVVYNLNQNTVRPDKIGYKPGFTIYDADDTKKAVASAMKKCEIDEKQLPIKSVIAQISKAKDQLKTPEVFASENAGDFRLSRVAKIYAMYQKQLEDFIERFALTVDGVEISTKPSLEEFWELLEEARLSVFAPEVPLGIRTPLKKLPDAWQELRF